MEDAALSVPTANVKEVKKRPTVGRGPLESGAEVCSERFYFPSLYYLGCSFLGGFLGLGGGVLALALAGGLAGGFVVVVALGAVVTAVLAGGGGNVFAGGGVEVFLTGV